MTLALREIHVGDCRDLLRQIPDESIDCVVTSPPYWGLRDYGTATWEGGDPACEHRGRLKLRSDTSGGTKGRFNRSRGTQASKMSTQPVRSRCRCGARRIDQQLGLEETPDEYVAKMVDVFREVRRVLGPAGTCWINIGDSYAGAAGGNGGLNSYLKNKTATKTGARRTPKKAAPGLKPKDMVGIPWSLALALRADGWWLRSEIIWHKNNPLPESAKDRPCRDHEQVFLLTKSPDYFYDAAAVKTPTTGGAHARASTRPAELGGVTPKAAAAVSPKDAGREQLGLKTSHSLGRGPGWRVRANPSFSAAVTQIVEERNLRTVWTMNGFQYDGAHFATFPPKLAETCIRAGCPAGGVVLDPFGGSGTVGEVCEAVGRNWILLELNPAYAALARRRVAQRGLFVSAG